MPVTVSVVGVGKIGWKHASILASMPDVTLGPLVDSDSEQANCAATQLGASSGSLDEAMTDADCLFVCTPDGEHFDIATRALEEGIHTFVEKPLSTTTAETEQLREMAAESEALSMVGHVLRFDPRYRTVRDTVANGKLGDVISVTFERLVKRARIRRTGAVSPASMRLGVHDFDLLEWLFDVSITALSANSSGGKLHSEGYDIDETVSILAELDTGATATLTMGFSLPEGHQSSITRTVATGTDGTVSIDASDTATQIWDNTAGTGVDTHLWPDIEGSPGGALARQDRAFLRAVRNNDVSPIPFKAGHRAVQVAEAVEDAIDDNGRITLSAL